MAVEKVSRGGGSRQKGFGLTSAPSGCARKGCPVYYRSISHACYTQRSLPTSATVALCWLVGTSSAMSLEARNIHSATTSGCALAHVQLPEGTSHHACGKGAKKYPRSQCVYMIGWDHMKGLHGMMLHDNLTTELSREYIVDLTVLRRGYAPPHKLPVHLRPDQVSAQPATE